MEIKIGNIFESKCSTIVNTVNCVGVMGKGIALEFKKRYPEMFSDYVKKCNLGLVKTGLPYVFDNGDGMKILNFPTKDHWRMPSKLSFVIEGLDWFVENYERYGITSIAFPPLGCGNGGLSWEVIGPVMYQKLCRLPIKIEVYAPFGTSKNELTVDFLLRTVVQNEVAGKSNSKINPKWYLILEAIRELNERAYSLKVGRTLYREMCYVLTREGVNTGFVFSKGNYGPYSAGVKDSITALSNANLIMERELGRMILVSVSDSVVIRKEDFSQEEWSVVERTVDLFSRIKSTDQAEMVTTVLYLYDELKREQQEVRDRDVYDFVMSWKPQWKSVKDYDVCDAIYNMAMYSFIKVSYNNLLPYGLDSYY